MAGIFELSIIHLFTVPAWIRKTGRLLGWSALTVIVGLMLLLLLLRMPVLQRWLGQKAAAYLAKETGADIQLAGLSFTYTGQLALKGLFVPDQNGDTLLYSGHLRAGIYLVPLYRGKISLKPFYWDKVVANVVQHADGSFNFTYLLAAFDNDESSETDATTAKPLYIKLSKIGLSRLRLRYLSELTGDVYQLRLHQLELQPGEFDVEQLRFGVAALKIDGLDANMKLHASETIADTATTTASPWLELKNIDLKNIRYRIEQPGNQTLAAQLNFLKLDEATINLAGEELQFGSLSTDGLDLSLLTLANAVASADAPASPFVWPGWRYSLRALDLTNYAIRLQDAAVKPTPAVFNAGDFMLQLNRLQLDEVRGEKNRLAVKKLLLDAREKSGLGVISSFSLKGSDKELELQNFELKTDNSEVFASLRLTYNSIQEALAKPLEQQLDLALTAGTLLSLKDALYFAPELARDSTIGPLIPWPLSLSGRVIGNNQLLELANWQLAWGKATQLDFSGAIFQPMDSLQRTVFLPSFAVKSSSHDVGILAQEKGYSYPASIQLTGSAQLNSDSAALQFEVLADGGKISGNASINQWQGSSPVFQLHTKASQLHLGQLVQDSLLGKVGWTSTLSGKGFDPNHMELLASVEFNQLQYQGYDYKALDLSAKAATGLWEATINHQDTALGLQLFASAQLDSLWPAYQLKAQLDRADLKKLGFREEPMELRLQLNANAQGKADSMKATILLNDGLVVQDKLAYPLRQFELSAALAPSASTLTLESDLLSGNFSANTAVETLVAAIRSELKAQWKRDSVEAIDSSQVAIVAAGKFDLHDSRLLREVLLPGIAVLDSGRFSFRFDQKKHELDFLAKVKNFDYEGTAVQHLFLDFSANQGLKMEAGFDRLEQGEVDIHRTRFQMSVVDSFVAAFFVVKDAWQQPVFRLQGAGSWQKDNRYFTLHPDSTMLNRQLWQADPRNRITLGDKLEFTDFRLSNQEQQLSIQTNPGEIRLTTNDFPLASISSILQADSLLATGTMSGYITWVDKEGQSGLLSELKITQLALLGQLLGDLKLEASMPAKNDYQLAAGITGPDLELTVAGNYRMPGTGTTLDMELDLKRFALKQLIALSDSAIRDAKGQLEGKLAINGPLKNPFYEGQMQFSDARLTVAAFNSSFGVSNRPILFDQQGLVINQLELTDENNQKLRLDGRILTGGRPEALFELKLKANDFRVLNSTRADNDLYYGVMRMNLDLSIGGSPSKPVIDAKARLNKGSKLSFIVPESQLDVVERDGVVLFSRVDPLADTLVDLQEQKTSVFVGMRLKATLEVDRESELILIMDERSGDQLSVSGEANLKYDIYTNGRTSMTGVYEIRRGQYELSLYELVKRKFELVPGGRIVWNGDVTDATLDLQALYRIKTGATDLMSAQLSGADESTRTRYRQELPFEVYMNIKGNMLKPNISFLLDMPEMQRNALDGNVYARIQQLNQQESDLNKQVFSLMVLNRFVPDVNSNSSGGNASASAMARSSVSQLLSSQLNNLSSQYVKGVDLNMDLDSYTDFSSGQAQDRTQLNVNVRKSFMGERLAVEVGRQLDVQGNAQASNDIIGDVSVEYRLSSDGAYRLRGFRRNQLEGLAEGPLVVTGMSLVLSREFNGFDELLKKKKERLPEPKPEERQKSEEQP